MVDQTETFQIPDDLYGKYSMLWFDNRQDLSLEAKIAKASSYYREKYKRAPQVCRMNSKDMLPGINSVGPIRLQAVRYIMPDYFLLGDEENLL